MLAPFGTEPRRGPTLASVPAEPNVIGRRVAAASPEPAAGCRSPDRRAECPPTEKPRNDSDEPRDDLDDDSDDVDSEAASDSA
jgi:hypothetical protein